MQEGLEPGGFGHQLLFARRLFGSSAPSTPLRLLSSARGGDFPCHRRRWTLAPPSLHRRRNGREGQAKLSEDRGFSARSSSILPQKQLPPHAHCPDLSSHRLTTCLVEVTEPGLLCCHRQNPALPGARTGPGAAGGQRSINGFEQRTAAHGSGGVSSNCSIDVEERW